ncbi:MAG TPA: hypothetical protein VJ625_08410 [Propionibacteriaceae bacterium]|nr:hypothetical protein [Propionibacteriaceae bacterium]
MSALVANLATATEPLVGVRVSLSRESLSAAALLWPSTQGVQ